MNFDEPVFFDYKLDEPTYIKNPQRIFVTHYTDLFGEWVPREWIMKILTVIANTKHDYIFLTKNPKRYYEFEFPDNCVCGVTVENTDQWDRVKMMQDMKVRKLCSVEPVMGDFTGMDFSQFEQVVIGRMMYFESEFRPEWVRSVTHRNIYYQTNVRGYR